MEKTFKTQSLDLNGYRLTSSGGLLVFNDIRVTTASESGSFYPASNPNNYITGDLTQYSFTGDLFSTGANLWNKIVSTGNILDIKVGILSGSGSSYYPRNNPSGYMTSGSFEIEPLTNGLITITPNAATIGTLMSSGSGAGTSYHTCYRVFLNAGGAPAGSYAGVSFYGLGVGDPVTNYQATPYSPFSVMFKGAVNPVAANTAYSFKIGDSSSAQYDSANPYLAANIIDDNNIELVVHDGSTRNSEIFGITGFLDYGHTRFNLILRWDGTSVFNCYLGYASSSAQPIPKPTLVGSVNYPIYADLQTGGFGYAVHSTGASTYFYKPALTVFQINAIEY